jgi:glycosyltransferase 2 family protein
MGNGANAARNPVLRWGLPVVLAGVLLYFALRGVEWGRVWTAIAHAHWQFLLAAGLITCGSSFLRGLRWRLLLNAEARFDVMTVFWAMMAGYLGNNFLPARAGELVRTFLISSRSTLTRTYVLTTALSERMMDAIALVLWSSIVLMGMHPKPAWLDQASRTAALFAGAGLLAVIVLPHTGNLCEAFIARLPLPHGIREKLLHFAQQILLGLKTFHDVRRFTAFTAFTALIWCADGCSAMVAARALDIDLPFGGALLLMCGLGLGSALPSTPGYVGIYQFVTVQVLTTFHVPQDTALAYSLISQAMGYAVVVALGLPGLYRFKNWRSAVAQAG